MDINQEYNEIRDDYFDFLQGVKNLMRKLLKDNNIAIAFDVSGRVKELSSIKEKNDSKRFQIKNTITELDDLVGLRVVLLFPEMKGIVEQILLKEFKQVKAPKRGNVPVDVDRFGYSSLHLVLGVKDNWQSYDWRKHTTKKIEVQIRSLSEHIWAETSHSLFYKREENIPKIIRRDLHRLSALLEVVDEKLDNIKRNVEKHFEDIKSSSFEDILRLDFNSETFRRIMFENSDGLYKLDDIHNKVLSAKIESDYNILNSGFFHYLIAGKIDISKINDQWEFIKEVRGILDAYKVEVDENQRQAKEKMDLNLEGKT